MHIWTWSMSACQVTWVIAALSSTSYIKESANQLCASHNFTFYINKFMFNRIKMKTECKTSWATFDWVAPVQGWWHHAAALHVHVQAGLILTTSTNCDVIVVFQRQNEHKQYSLKVHKALKDAAVSLPKFTMNGSITRSRVHGQHFSYRNTIMGP